MVLSCTCSFEHKDFYVTLSAADNHDVAKDIHCVLFLDLRSLSEKQFNMAFLASRPSSATQLALAYRTQYPKSEVSHIRIAESMPPKQAIAAYMYILSLTPNEKTKVYVNNKVVSLLLKTEPLPICTSKEVIDAKSFVSESFPEYLDDTPAPVRRLIQVAYPECMSSHPATVPFQCPPCEPINLCTHNKATRGLETYILPRFFRYLVPHRLAIMSIPRSEDDIT